MSRYHQQLKDLSEIRFIDVLPVSTCIPFRVALYAEGAEALRKYLESKGIENRTFFYPLHRQPAFKYLNENSAYQSRLKDECFPGAIYAYENGICLPSYPGLPADEIDFVCDRIKEFYGK